MAARRNIMAYNIHVCITLRWMFSMIAPGHEAMALSADVCHVMSVDRVCASHPCSAAKGKRTSRSNIPVMSTVANGTAMRLAGRK